MAWVALALVFAVGFVAVNLATYAIWKSWRDDGRRRKSSGEHEITEQRIEGIRRDLDRLRHEIEDEGPRHP